MNDLDIVDQFKNFLSWQVRPCDPGFVAYAPNILPITRPVPPAWFAYALGLTEYCPPQGEL